MFLVWACVWDRGDESGSVKKKGVVSHISGSGSLQKEGLPAVGYL